jgi:hypothetical protein
MARTRIHRRPQHQLLQQERPFHRHKRRLIGEALPIGITAFDDVRKRLR